jgi:DNA helicase II / ATP-dependent DNA helicase PcrA
MEEKFLELFNKLNEQQKKAVQTVYGPLVVNAGPGTGKTQILSLRIANILRMTDALPNNILCLTFTEAAAENMRQRLSTIIGRDAYRVAIHTFHSFGMEMINQYPYYFFQGMSFAPIDELGQIKILNEIFRELEFDDPLKSYHPLFGHTYLQDCKNLIGHTKTAGISSEEYQRILEFNKQYLEEFNTIISEYFDVPKMNKGILEKAEEILLKVNSIKNPYNELSPENALDDYLLTFCNIQHFLGYSFATAVEEALETGKTNSLTAWKNKYLVKDSSNRPILKDLHNWNKMKSFANVYSSYQQKLYEQGYMDFSDMIMQAVHALEDEDKKDLRYTLQERYQYILVDEFQDTNGVQLRLLLNMISNDQSANVMVVGDPDQAIYKFQGATISNLTQFMHRFPDSGIINLFYNYRSRQQILDLAGKVIKKCDSRLGRSEELISVLR